MKKVIFSLATTLFLTMAISACNENKEQINIPEQPYKDNGYQKPNDKYKKWIKRSDAPNQKQSPPNKEEPE